MTWRRMRAGVTSAAAAPPGEVSDVLLHLAQIGEIELNAAAGAASIASAGYHFAAGQGM